MPWYRTGTVSLTNGSKNVVGTDTLWSTSVNPGDAFAIVDANGNPTGAWYEVATVTNNVGLTLVQSYAGSTVSNQNYVVFNLVGNMTTPSFAQRLAQFFDQFNDLIDQPTTTPTANMIPIADSGGKLNYGWLPDASTTTKGAVELATTAEAQAGTDATRAVTPAALLGAMVDFGFHPSGGKTAPADLNTLLTPGVYAGPGAGSDRVNWPHNGIYGTIIVTKRGSGVTQFVYLALPTSSGTSNVQIAVIRFFDGTSWTEFDLRKPHVFEVTSTDDATSNTSAPARIYGGLAVAKTIWAGSIALSGVQFIIPPEESMTHDIALSGMGGWRITVVGYGNAYSGNVACEWIVTGYASETAQASALKINEILNSVDGGSAQLTGQPDGIVRLVLSNTRTDPSYRKTVKLHVSKLL